MQPIQRLLLLLVLLTGPPPAWSAFEAFLKIESVEGEAADPWHTNWVEVVAVTNDMVRVALPASPGSRVDSSLIVVKELDKASPKLYEACGNGQHFREVVLDCCAPRTGQIGFYQINLSNVVVRRVEHASAALGPRGRSTERIVLGYDRISWTYTRFTLPSGLPREYRASYWDLLQNAGGAAAQAALFKVAGIQNQAGQVVLRWLSEAGTSYRIFSAPQIDGAFSLLAEVTPAGDELATYTAPVGPGALFFAVEEKP